MNNSHKKSEVMKRPWNIPFTMDATNEDGSKSPTLIFPSIGMKMIGIRLLPMPELKGMDEREMKCMQKSLHSKNPGWYYFYKGFDIKPVDGYEDQYEVFMDDNAFDSDVLLYRESPYVIPIKKDIGKSQLSNISIGAIVGENGTGKSTIVDMVIRLLNNLSAAFFGEDYIYNSAQHLHYIENVYASLAVYLDDKIRILTVKGRNVWVDTLVRSTEDYSQDLTPSVHHFGGRMERVVVLSKDRNACKSIALEGCACKEIRDLIFNDWFYTVVSNYSLYAYNYRDYIYEKSDESKIKDLNKDSSEPLKEDDYFWLKGVFYKNDGYQTPIVVNPMREGGYINAQKENYLGKNNLMSLAYVKVQKMDENGLLSDTFPFRIINQTHLLVTQDHQWCPWNEYTPLLERVRSQNFEDKKARIRRDNFVKSYSHIVRFWAEKIGVADKAVPYEDGVRHDPQQQVWDYVVKKTHKVLSNYIKYSNESYYLEDCFNEENGVAEYLDNLITDSTHRTRKLRRSLAFLKFLPEHYSLKAGKQDINEIYAWMQTKVGQNLFENADARTIDENDLLPPPCCHVALGLITLDEKSRYEANKKAYSDTIPFSGLSSGERQIAYTLGNLMYHIINIDSTVDDVLRGGESETIHYPHINIIMDEVELYFHPDLQRRFVHLLVDSLNSMMWSYVRSVNVTMVTHSPFILSDIPGSNILVLKKNECDVVDKTFAANIHDMFSNTFFLPDTIGELAKEHIETFVYNYHQQINYWYEQDQLGRKRDINSMAFNNFVKHKEQYRYLCSIIGDEYLRRELMDMYKELEDYYNQNPIAINEDA